MSTPIATGAPAADSGPFAELQALLGREAEVASDGRRRADLLVRLGLLSWDVLDDLEATQRYLLAAGADHPLALRLRLALALSQRDASAIQALGDELTAVSSQPGKPPAARRDLELELAELWLFRQNDAVRAAACAREALSRHASDRQARDLLALALAVAKSSEELTQHLLSPPEDDSAALVDAARLLFDTGGDTARATKLALAGLDKTPASGSIAYPLELLLAQALQGTAEAEPLLRTKLTLLGEDPRGAAERAATEYLLARMIEDKEPAQAQATFSKLSLEAVPFGQRLALWARRRLALRTSAWPELVEIMRELGRTAGIPSISRVYARRCAELLETRLGDSAKAEETWAELFAADPGNPAVASALERMRLVRGAWAELVAQEEAHARASSTARSSSLRRAAMIVELQSGDLEGAARLRRESLFEGDTGGLQDLARIYRRMGDKVRLWGTYQREAQERQLRAQASGTTEAAFEEEARCVGLLHAAIGALQLSLGQMREAEEQLTSAIACASDDVFSRAALCWVYRRSGRYRELGRALTELLPLLSTDRARASYWRELGAVSGERLGDAKAAQQAFERALEIEPADAGALHALARLLGESGDWGRSVGLRERAVEVAGPSRQSAAILLEIGEIYEKQLSQDDKARAAYERALEIDPEAVLALHALAQLHRKAKRFPELLAVLRRELALSHKASRRVTLHLEIARHEDAAGGNSEAALENYRAALEGDPGNAPALAGLERICRREGRWEQLLGALKTAPRTPRTSRSMGEVLEQLGRWEDLAQLRRVELEVLEDPKESSRVCRSLAQLYEERLGDPDSAIRFYRRALDMDAEDPQAARALQRLHEARGRFEDLAWALEQELSRRIDKPRQIAVLTQLGEVRATKLAKLDDAAWAYEQILTHEEAHLPALRALTELYGRLGREGDLARILDRTAAAVGDTATRGEILVRKAELAESRGDFDMAIATLREAFLADPASRAAFTALERICYKQERWHDAMALYDKAIELCEKGTLRAYRLADLYSRRGQLQMQYLGQSGEAAASYLHVLELDPENETAIKFLETIFSKQSDWRGLISAYEKRVELLPGGSTEKRIETLRRAARVAGAKLKDTQEAVRLYGRIHETDPTDTEALDALERYYEHAREYEKLVDVLHTRLQLTPDQGDMAVLHMRIASIYEEGVRNIDRAIETLQQVLTLDPNHKMALDALARICEGTERWADFIETTRRQIKVTQDRQAKALLYFKCGSVMEAKFGKDDEAIRYYDAAIKTSSSCLPALHGLRDVYLRRQDWQRVIQTLELEAKVWQEDKERAGVFARIGQIYGDHLNDPRRALQYYENALRVDSESLPANRALFDLHFRRSDWPRAAQLGALLAQKAPREGDPAERSDFYRKRGVVLGETGDPRAAAESLVIALELKSDNLEALDALVALCRRAPEAYDFAATFGELEKIYRRQDDRRALARVLLVTGTLLQGDYQVVQAEAAFREAIALDTDELSVAEPLVELLIALRRFAEANGPLAALLARKPPPEVCARIHLRMAEIASDCMMEPARAAASLQALLQLLPRHREGLFRLAQELYLLGRFAEAQRTVEQLIEYAASPEDTAPPEELARYYYYLGRVLEAQGEAGSAAARYRRAAEYDPGYPPPVLALAKRAASQGDRRGAEAVLSAATRAAAERDPKMALQLQRGLAQIHLAAGDREAAIAEYRSIIKAGTDSLDDRVALAEIYARDKNDISRAAEELGRVLDKDLRHASAYRLLVSLYDKLGERERVVRVLAILDMLGYAEDVERSYLGSLRQRLAAAGTRRGELSDALRAQFILPAEAQGAMFEVFQLVREQLLQVYQAQYVGENPRQIEDPGLITLAKEMLRLHKIEAGVMIADGVPGGVISFDVRQPIAVIDQSYLDMPEAERRFLLGYALEPLRGGYALLMRLGPGERLAVANLIAQLLGPEDKRDAQTVEFSRTLPRKAQKALERLAGSSQPPDSAAWLGALQLATDRAGLVSCDDMAASARVLVRMGGSTLQAAVDGAIALGAVPGGADLVRYYLGEDYHRLGQALVQAAGK